MHSRVEFLFSLPSVVHIFDSHGRILSRLARHLALLSLPDYRTHHSVGSLIVDALRLSTSLILLAASFLGSRATRSCLSPAPDRTHRRVGSLILAPILFSYTEVILSGRILSRIAHHRPPSPAEYRKLRRLGSVIPNVSTSGVFQICSPSVVDRFDSSWAHPLLERSPPALLSHPLSGRSLPAPLSSRIPSALICYTKRIVVSGHPCLSRA
jgi:hypothetical protein